MTEIPAMRGTAMNTRCLRALSFVLCFAGSAALAQQPALLPSDKLPVLQVEAGGPTASVTALAFRADGRALYAAGFDKVVRVWALNDDQRFVLNTTAYRVPLGPGLD